MDYTIVLPSATRVVSEEENKGIYVIEGLYPGYGHTLGNSLRRILLSSLPGAAVTRVRIEGINHEFSTIPGIAEDVVRLLLNIKQLRFHLEGDEPQVATLEVSGVRDAKGKDIKCPSQLTVVNKDNHIVTLTDKTASLKIELTVERGLGFVPSEELVREKVAVGTLQLDAIFTPMRRVTYEVENMRVGDRTDYNRLRISIETDGTITPREAYAKAIAIMRAQMEQISHVEEKGASFAMESQETPESPETSLKQLEVSVRTENALIAEGLYSPKLVAEKSAQELLAIDGIGQKAIKEIEGGLEKLGMKLKEE